MKFFTQNKNAIVLLIFSIVFFCAYNFLNFSVPGIYNSPDETANAEFIRQFAQYDRLSYPLPYEYAEFAEFIHPRSTFVEEIGGTHILPTGFWGMAAVFGLIAKIVGMNAIIFFTSILTIVAAWAFYGILKKIFSERVALWSAILFLCHPVVWYYTARSMFHNVPFVSLLLIGTWILMINPVKNLIEYRHARWKGFKRISFCMDDIVGMSIFMLGILMRPNEILWIAIAACIVIFAYRRQIPFSRLLTWIIISLLFIAVYAWGNLKIYGNPVGGYVSSRSIGIPHWYSFIFPFGIDPALLLKTGWFYFVKMFWWYVVPACMGIILFIFLWSRKVVTRAQKIYFFVLLFVSFFLFVYYGSNYDTLYELKTIGVAYTRYWIPIFIVSIPFIVYVWDYFFVRYTKLFLGVGIVGLVFLIGLNSSRVFNGIDGLYANRDALTYTRSIQESVLAYTSARDILISDSEDKFFWPHRQVIVRFFDPRVGSAIADMLEKPWEMYYVTYTLNTAEFTQRTEYLNQFGVQMKIVQQFDKHQMYKLSK